MDAASADATASAAAASDAREPPAALHVRYVSARATAVMLTPVAQRRKVKSECATTVASRRPSCGALAARPCGTAGASAKSPGGRQGTRPCARNQNRVRRPPPSHAPSHSYTCGGLVQLVRPQARSYAHGSVTHHSRTWLVPCSGCVVQSRHGRRSPTWTSSPSRRRTSAPGTSRA